jgi:hypothetical protein
MAEGIYSLDQLFTYHAPDERQKDALKNIRDKAKELAYIIHERCPSGPDRTAAIRLLREAVMTANAAVVLNGLTYP